MVKKYGVFASTQMIDKSFSIFFDLLCVLNEDGLVSETNQAWQEKMSYSNHDLVNHSFMDGTHPNDKEHTQTSLDQTIKQHASSNFTNRYIDKLGHYHYIEWVSSFHEDKILLAGRDLSDRITKQKNLEEEESNFYTLFDSADDLIFIVSQESKILQVNRSACEKMGYPKTELLGMSIFDIHPPKYRDEAKLIFSEMLKGKLDVCPLPLFKKDQTLLSVETRVWSGKWDGKDCIFGVSKDLTELNQSINRFHQIFDTNPALMAVSRIEDTRFIEVNSAFLLNLGYSREEIIGKRTDELNLFPEIEKQKEVARQLQANGRISNVELKVIKKDGTLLDGLFSGEIIDNQGELSFLTVMIDITKQRENERQLIQTQNLMRVVLDNLPFAIWFKDINGTYKQINKEFERMLSIKSDEAIGHTDYDLWPSQQADENIREDQEVMRMGRQYYADELRTINHKEPWIEKFKIPIHDINGEVIGTTGVSRDVTEKKELELALKESETRFKQLSEIFPESIFETDIKGKCVYVNEHAQKTFGYTEEEILNLTLVDFIAPLDKERVMNRIKGKYLGDELGYLEFQAVKKSGEIFDAMGYTVVIMKDGVPIGLRGFLLDISLRKKYEMSLVEANLKLEQLAITDDLTNLLNRRELKRVMEYERYRYERNKVVYSMVMLDIDFFKNINDTYGHNGGDFILKELAQVLQACTRQQDLVCRWGGEEFLLFLPETHSQEAALVAERIRLAVSSHDFIYHKQNIKITVTLGIAQCDYVMSTEQLIDQADQALYQGKQAGRNCIVIYNQ